MVQLLVANLVLAGVILLLNEPVPAWLAAGASDRATDMAILVAAGGGAYFLALALSGVRIRHFVRR